MYRTISLVSLNSKLNKQITITKNNSSLIINKRIYINKMSQFIQSIYSSKFTSIDIDSISETKDLKNNPNFSSLEVQSILTETKEILTETKEEAVLSNFIFKNLLHLSRKEQLSSVPKPNPQKKSSLLQDQISKLNPKANHSKPLKSSLKIDPSLISKLKHLNTYEEIKAGGSSEDLLKENEELRKKLAEIEKQDFLKRQLTKLAAKEINSNTFSRS